MAKVIWLHGASSSGKSTIARALQARIEEPFWHYSIDHLRDAGVLPMGRIRNREFAWSTLRDQFFSGFHQSIGAFAGAGNNLILEHILDTPTWRKQMIEVLRPHDVYFVGVHCSLDVLRRRQEARGDRPPGSAEADFHNIHRGLTYDLELDSEAAPEANVDRLLSTWRSRASPSVLLGLQD